MIASGVFFFRRNVLAAGNTRSKHDIAFHHIATYALSLQLGLELTACRNAGGQGEVLVDDLRSFISELHKHSPFL